MKLLEGKVALITGASRGIGRCIAETFATHGATVAYTDLHHSDAVNELEAYMRSKEVASRYFASNAADFAQSQHVIDEVVKEFGRLDVLINNAGITMDNLLLRMTEEQWEKVLHVNLNSVFYNTKAATKYMMKQRSGSIINMSSVVGVSGNAGQSNYSASKAGMIGFTKSIAKELGSRNVRCNAIAPGFIQTEMTANLPPAEIEAWNQQIPLKRPGVPQDIANICVFLGSDLSTYVTGQVIHGDGGMLM